MVLECLCQRTHGWRSHSSASLEGRWDRPAWSEQPHCRLSPRLSVPHICLSSSQCERNPCPMDSRPCRHMPKTISFHYLSLPSNLKTPSHSSAWPQPQPLVGRGPTACALGLWVGTAATLRDAALRPPDWELILVQTLEGLRRWRWMSTCPANTWTARSRPATCPRSPSLCPLMTSEGVLRSRGAAAWARFSSAEAWLRAWAQQTSLPAYLSPWLPGQHRTPSRC